MTTLQDKGKALESKFFKDEELNFKATSRRRKLLGLWASEFMQLDDEKALEYALSIVRFGVENKEDGAVVKKILNDIQNAGMDITEEEVREKMTDLHFQAIREIEQRFQEGSL